LSGRPTTPKAPYRWRVFELAPRLVECTEHRVFSCQCAGCGQTSWRTKPAATSQSGHYGVGADVMIPMAVPSVGGMALALLSLFVVPVLYGLIEEGG